MTTGKAVDTRELLTEAARQSGGVVVMTHSDESTSSTRRMPYVERYGQFSGLSESPIERLQQAARDEAKRESV